MKKKQLFGLILALLVTMLIPNNINAKETKVICKYQYQNQELVYTINSKVTIPFEDGDNNWYHGQETKPRAYHTAYGDPNTEGWTYESNQNCSDNNSILGSYNDPNSVAYFLKIVFGWLKLIGPFIVIVMSGIDFAKVIIMGDDDGMKKAQSKLIIRLLLAASLFFLPDLLSALLELFNITSSGICGLQ